MTGQIHAGRRVTLTEDSAGIASAIIALTRGPLPVTPSRFTGDDLVCLSAAILAELDLVKGRAPSMAEDFNRVMRTVPAAVGRRPLELLESELEELAEMVTDAIAGYVPRRRDVPAESVRVGDIIDDERAAYVLRVGYIARGRRFLTFRAFHPEAHVSPNPAVRVLIGDTVTVAR